MIQFTEYCTSKIVKIICLGPSNFDLRKTLSDRILQQKSGIATQRWRIHSTHELYDKMFESIFNILRQYKKSTVTYMALYAILCNTVRKRYSQRAMHKVWLYSNIKWYSLCWCTYRLQKNMCWRYFIRHKNNQ